MIKSLFKSAVAFAAIGFSAVAMATPVYEYNIDNPPGSANGGDITNIYTNYDADNSLFHWSSTLTQTNGQFTDGFWLVISDGPNPKSQGGEYAIMCGDLNTGILTINTYNGVNGNNSCYDSAGFIDSTSAGFISVSDSGTSRTFSFTLDVADINDYNKDPDWDGISFAENIGVWFHPSRGSVFNYDSNNQLTSYSFAGQGWYDTKDRTTTPVPTPASILLFALGLPLMLRRRR
ncbi:PEP-CTERM sorting domain-containing protein [Pleionea sp. CnH1-48]|uniref:PEP-CTERM sorting domain-containing protein n=1 Tax=Pleionea sp. CnH1-48 TaxID=2954494 RepID=UPI0020984DB2|nr:PEP-CTERM sorting domain-containing protein [Pleionea sp. CnH1-48]MCO7224603.1 PEP-CTERM sorting domain-containing protein [Pleionea sp. CnH1-48]